MRQERDHMYLRFLPANQAWVFLFGDDLETAQIIDMGDYGKFFPTRSEAVDAAESCGLQVDAPGAVHQKTSPA